MRKLYAWQEEAIKRFSGKSFFAIICSCGLGKTLAAIKIALNKALPVIVIAPGHRLCEQWKHDILTEDPEAKIWVYSRPEEAKEGEMDYRMRFNSWLIQ
jgi:superfamily II DNA or RNA helicase